MLWSFCELEPSTWNFWKKEKRKRSVKERCQRSVTTSIKGNIVEEHFQRYVIDSVLCKLMLVWHLYTNLRENAEKLTTYTANVSCIFGEYRDCHCIGCILGVHKSITLIWGSLIDKITPTYPYIFVQILSKNHQRTIESLIRGCRILLNLIKSYLLYLLYLFYFYFLFSGIILHGQWEKQFRLIRIA